MGSKHNGDIENYIILVPFSAKMWVSIEFLEQFMGSRTLFSKLTVSFRTHGTLANGAPE